MLFSLFSLLFGSVFVPPAEAASLPTAEAIAARAAEVSLPAGAVIDEGRIVSERQVVWPPRARSDDVRNGYVYEFERKDGSRQSLAQIDGEDFPKGARVYVLRGPPLRVVAAASYDARANAGARDADSEAAASVVVRGRRAVSVTDAREHAHGKDWNKVYCQTERATGTLIPRQICLTLADWDLLHQKAEELRLSKMQLPDAGR